MKSTLRSVLLAILSGVLLGYLFGYSTPAESLRTGWLAGIFAMVGLLAVIFPHVLFTGALRNRWMISVPGTIRLQLELLFQPLPWILFPLTTVTIIGVLGQISAGQLVMSVLQILAIFSTAVSISLFSGRWSQEFKTGIRGDSIRESARETGAISVSVGALPAMGQTLFIAVFGTLFIIFTATPGPLSWTITVFALSLPFIFFAGYSDHLWGRALQSEAFFAEYFQPVDEDLQHRRTVDRLYWIPVPVRPLANTYLIHSDRSGSVQRWFWPAYLGAIMLSWYTALPTAPLAAVLILLPLFELLIIQRALTPSLNAIFWINSRWHQLLAPLFVGIRWSPWLTFTWWMMDQPLAITTLLYIHLITLTVWSILTFLFFQLLNYKAHHA